MNSSFIGKNPSGASNQRLIILLIIGIGIIFRLFHYFYNRSLWMDEIYLCSGLLHFDFRDLAHHTLDYQQKAPIGFLWAVKLSLNTFGTSEFAFRLVPLCAGIISLFLFAKVAERFLHPTGQCLALIIFACAPALVYHSVEIKQYSTECFATIVALYAYTRCEHDHKLQTKLMWGIVGSALLWISFSVIFILGGMAIGLSIYYLCRKKWKQLIISSSAFLMWLLSFVINYLLFTHKHAESKWIVYFFKVYDNFMPFPPLTLEQLKWFPRNYISMMDYPLGEPFPLIPTVLLVTGIVLLFRKNSKTLTIFIAPIILVCIASGLYLYPLLERFWVFLSPIFIILIAVGFDHCCRLIKKRAILICVFILSISGPVGQSIFFIFHPENFYKNKKSYERESLEYINHHLQPGDAVYNYWNNRPGYHVYQQINAYNFKAIQGSDFRHKSQNISEYNGQLKSELKQFKGNKRLWVIFNNQFLTDIGDKVDDPLWYYKTNITPLGNLTSIVQQMGKPIQHFINNDVSIYLFDLNSR